MASKLRKKLIGLPVIWQVRKLYLNWLMSRPALIKHVKDYNDFFFKEIAVSREDTINLYDKITGELDFKYKGDKDFQLAFHRIAFSGLAVSGFQPQNILELGTNRGETAIFLSKLFPDANIVTVELPSDDPIYKEIPTENSRLIEERNLMCADLPNVTCLRHNTAFLAGLDLPKFDLIWLDAGHHYPEIAWDHFYCLGKLAPNGWLFSDDVVLPGKTDGNKIFEVIMYYNNRISNGKFKYLLTRESVFYYINKLKYIGYYHNSSK